MGPEETEKSIEEIVGMIKQGDLSLAPKLYEHTKGIICYVVWREWRREHIRRGAKARGMEVEDLLQEGYFMMIQSAQLYDSSIGASFKAYLFAHIRGRLKAMTAFRKVDNTRSLSEPFGAGDDAGPLEEIVEDPTALRDFAAVEDRDYLDRLRSDLNDSIEELSSEQAEAIRGKYIESRLVKDLASDLKIAEKKIALIEERALRELRKSERLQIYREDIISRYSLRGTFSAFKSSRVNAVELAVIKLDELERKELRHLERKEWSAEAHRQKRAAWADVILNTKGREEHGEDQ